MGTASPQFLGETLVEVRYTKQNCAEFEVMDHEKGGGTVVRMIIQDRSNFET